MITFLRPAMLICGLLTILCLNIPAQTEKLFLGLRLRSDVRAVADEVEKKTGRKITAVFDEFEDEFTLGTSFIGDDGTAYLRVNPNLKSQPQKLEAVIAHELLHLRLRADGFPVFLFSRSIKTGRGLAQDVEQPNVNDLASLIEHRIFRAEMEKFGLNEIVDLAGDTARNAERRGDTDSQADAVNFARAVLEYRKPADVERLRKIYIQNGWQKSLKIGQEIADLINRTSIDSPETSAKVFGQCLAKLYPSPRPFKLTPDKTVKAYRQMIIGF